MKASSAFVTGIVIGAAAGIVAGAAYMKHKIEEVIAIIIKKHGATQQDHNRTLDKMRRKHNDA